MIPIDVKMPINRNRKMQNVQMVGRKFKHVTDEQLEELAHRVEAKMKKGCSIEEALFYCQVYAVCEELMSMREEINAQNESLDEFIDEMGIGKDDRLDK